MIIRGQTVDPDFVDSSYADIIIYWKHLLKHSQTTVK